MLEFSKSVSGCLRFTQIKNLRLRWHFLHYPEESQLNVCGVCLCWCVSSGCTLAEVLPYVFSDLVIEVCV